MLTILALLLEKIMPEVNVLPGWFRLFEFCGIRVYQRQEEESQLEDNDGGAF